jgi:hypothetical protein
MEPLLVCKLKCPLPACQSYLKVYGVVKHYLGLLDLGHRLRHTQLSFLDGWGGGFWTSEGGEDGNERKQWGQCHQLLQ